jgi:single-strand DNA-binding protein
MPVSEFGRIGRDAELRFTGSGDAVCSVPVAVDYGRKGQDGKKPCQWYEVTLWGKQAEALAQYLTKGKQIFFVGSDLNVQTFQKGDGSQGTKLVCRCAELKFASDGQQAQQQRPAQPAPRNASQPQRQAPQPVDDFDDQSIPF